MGAAPFVRTADGWAPSTAVAGLIELAMTFEGNLKREINAMAPADERAPVDLRIGCTPTVLMSVLIPGLCLRGTDMEHIHYEFGERVFGEGLGDCDVLVSHGALRTGRVLTRRVSDVQFAIFGPPDAQTSGNWVGLTERHDALGVMQLGFETFEKPPVLRADNLIALSRIMVETGLPGPLPRMFACRLEGMSPIGTAQVHSEVWMSYHESRRGDPAIDATLAWIESCFAEAARISAVVSELHDLRPTK